MATRSAVSRSISSTERPLRAQGGTHRLLDGACRAVALERGDGAVGKDQPIALPLPHHELHPVRHEPAGLRVVVDLAGALEKIQRNLDRVFHHQRRSIAEVGGHSRLQIGFTPDKHRSSSLLARRYGAARQGTIAVITGWPGSSFVWRISTWRWTKRKSAISSAATRSRGLQSMALTTARSVRSNAS